MLSDSMEVRRPGTLAEALSLLQEQDRECRVIAGGTDLIPRLKKGLAPPERLLDISLLESELSQVRLEEGNLYLGALTTHDQVCRSRLLRERVPALAEACLAVGSQQIRNRGTLGGNIANASPAADSLPPLLALDAAVQLVSLRGSRVLPLDEFLIGPGRTKLNSDELIAAVRIPADSLNGRGRFKKLGLRNALTISVASAAVVISQDGRCRISYGALAPRPFRAGGLESALNERGLRAWAALQELIRQQVQPISDVRASAWYRREMAVNMTYMALMELNLILS